MVSVQELLRKADGLPGDSPRREGEILLGFCLGKPRSWLYTWPESDVPAEQVAHYLQLLEQRTAGKPVAYLTGTRDFWSLQLQVSPDTLIPRPDTETLVEWGLELPLPARAKILDLGTGSGAIALALAIERPAWQVYASDVSAAALRVARANGDACIPDAVQFLESDWFSAFAGQSFELIVSNPPYIDAEDPHLGQGDLRYEPSGALVAGAGGMADLATLVEQAPAYLQPGGWLLLEHGFEQGAAVREQMRRAGFRDVATRADIEGRERITGGQYRAD